LHLLYKDDFKNLKKNEFYQIFAFDRRTVVIIMASGGRYLCPCLVVRGEYVQRCDKLRTQKECPGRGWHRRCLCGKISDVSDLETPHACELQAGTVLDVKKMQSLEVTKYALKLHYCHYCHRSRDSPRPNCRAKFHPKNADGAAQESPVVEEEVEE
jgi:hypothetical protein